MGLSILAITACGGSKTNNIEDTPEIITPEETQKLNCNIYEGTPKTDTKITVKVVCKNGTIPIESATVTLDNHTKDIEYKGANFIDYLGFSGLKSSTSYSIKLEVLVADKSITDTITIKTKLQSISGPTSITHNGTTYGFITSSATGKVWLDRNLGAAQICTSSTDTACYGDYYQWGRNFDGHEDSMSSTTTTLATDVNNVGNQNFILNNTPPYTYDWTALDSSGAIRATNISKTDGSSVCPVGFRVPTRTEFMAEYGSWGGLSGAFSALRIPAAGSREYIAAQPANLGTQGEYWTSSSIAVNILAYYLVIGTNTNVTTGDYRSVGRSIRCIKN